MKLKELKKRLDPSDTKHKHIKTPGRVTATNACRKKGK